MSDEQIGQQHQQSEQDAIMLDFVKWGDQPRGAKLSTDHDL